MDILYKSVPHDGITKFFPSVLDAVMFRLRCEIGSGPDGSWTDKKLPLSFWSGLH